MAQVKYFNCPGGCGATLKVRVDLKRSYVCPGCGKAFDLEALKPYRARHKDLKPTVTTTQCFFTFKPDKKARGRSGNLYR